MLGDKINYYRRLRGCRVEDVADALDVTRQAVTNWESGKNIPDVLSMKKMADFLSIPLERFLVEEQEELQEPEMAVKMGPEERYIFGRITIGGNGRIRIPKEAMQKLGLKPGDKLVVLGDLERGLEFIYEDILWQGTRQKLLEYEALSKVDDDEEKDYHS